jgi:hypothetical protein
MQTQARSLSEVPMFNRFVQFFGGALVVYAILAALAILPTPALASDECDDDECDTPPVTNVQPATPPAPAPTVAPAPAPAPAPATPRQEVKSVRVSSPKRTVHHQRHHTRRTTHVQTVRRTTVALMSTFPTGGVQAGAGGTAAAPSGPDGALLGLAGGGLLLLASGGGLIVRARREGS